MDVSAQTLISIDATSWPEAFRQKARTCLNEIAIEAMLPEAEPESPWTPVLLEVMLRLVADKRTAQMKAIKKAIENGGTVTRAEVYELAGYEPKRSLKGFTRPCNRITKDLKAEGLVPEDAPELLVPFYPPGPKGYQRAQAFMVPAGLRWDFALAG